MVTHVKCIGLPNDYRIKELAKIGEIYSVQNKYRIMSHSGEWICDVGSLNGDRYFISIDSNSTLSILSNL